MFKMDCDPRVIGSGKKSRRGHPRGIGHFIRRTSLDEFPQFFNVLKGEMGLVGTRPPTVDEWELYDLHHRIRMAIKPGLTCTNLEHLDRETVEKLIDYILVGKKDPVTKEVPVEIHWNF